jgi:hypothetical protein
MTMTDMSCASWIELGPELALNVLSGKQRADAAAHLERCPRCRAAMSAFCDTADQLLELIPEESPPAGFEVRALTAIATPVVRTHYWSVVAAALVLAVAMLSGGWLIGHSGTLTNGDDSHAGMRTVLYAPLTTSAGERVGQAYLYPDNPGWMYLTVPLPPPNAMIHCAILHSNSTTTPLGDFPLTGRLAAWQFTQPLKDNTIVTASITDLQGHVLSTAQFSPTQPTNK